MVRLLMFLLIGIESYGGLTLLNAVISDFSLSSSLRSHLSLTALFFFTGLSHFFMPEEIAQILPASISLRFEIIYVIGAFEILGAIGLLIPRLKRLAGMALILFLLGVLPANIYAAFHYEEVESHGLGSIYLLPGTPLQGFMIGWPY